MEYHYTIPGEPIPQARPRFARTTRGTRVYDPQKDRKVIIGITLKSQHIGPLLVGPLKIDATFYFYIPRTRRKTKPGFYHVFKPDLDNLLKLYLDIGKNIVFVDDCIIAEISCRKKYDTEPRTEITITKLEHHEKKETTKKTIK